MGIWLKLLWYSILDYLIKFKCMVVLAIDC